MRAMVLAAGLGTRLRPITYELPKPLVPVLDRPVMEHILELIAKHGFEEAITNLSHLPEQIRNRFGDGSGLGISLSYSVEEELLGTAGGVRNVSEFFGDEAFAIISGDALTDVDLSAMRAAHEANGGIATLALKPVPDPREYGVVILGDDGRIQGFQEKPAPGEELSDLANCGIYMFQPEIFDYFPETAFVDWATDVFPVLLDNDVPFHGHGIDAYWNDVGSIEEYRQSNFDALAGEVKLTPGEHDDDAIPADAEVEGDVFVGAGADIGAVTRLAGPLVIGREARVGKGSQLKESVLLPGTEIAAGTMLMRAVAGTRPA